jgi:hypothetical protein
VYLLLEIPKYSYHCFNRISQIFTDEEGNEIVPVEIQQKLSDFAKEKLLPALLGYLAYKNPVLGGINLQFISLAEVSNWNKELDLAFSRERQYDIFLLSPIVMLPIDDYPKMLGVKLIGAAIRLCKAMEKQEYADRFNEIVEGYFTPEEHPDLTARAWTYFI